MFYKFNDTIYDYKPDYTYKKNITIEDGRNITILGSCLKLKFKILCSLLVVLAILATIAYPIIYNRFIGINLELNIPNTFFYDDATKTLDIDVVNSISSKGAVYLEIQEMNGNSLFITEEIEPNQSIGSIPIDLELNTSKRVNVIIYVDNEEDKGVELSKVERLISIKQS